MPRMKSAGAELYYEIQGDGPPLMLVAGLASDSQSWQPVMGPLAGRYRIIAPDSRGVGRTTPQDAETGIGRMADDCLALLDHLGLPSAHLLGHSMGGLVAVDFAARFPDRVDKLVLAATPAALSLRNRLLFADWAAGLEAGMSPELWFRNLFYWIFSRRFFENQAAVDAALCFALNYPYPQAASAFRSQVSALSGFAGGEKLAAIRAETLVLGGEEDILFPPEELAGLAKAVDGAELNMIAGAGHALHVEAPQAFAARVAAFLADAGRSSPV